MINTQNPNGFILKHGGYEKLFSYQKSEIVYDGTYYFCKKWLKPFDRTVDQMIQAARSCKQNIVEGSMASGTSKETEIKLTNVARASLEELIQDYKDFIRTRNLTLWDKDHPYYAKLTQKITNKEATYTTLQKGIESDDAEVAANMMLALSSITSFLLKKQIDALENNFLKEGGIRERMTKARIEARKR